MSVLCFYFHCVESMGRNGLGCRAGRSKVECLLQLGLPRRGMQGSVHGLCVVGFAVRLGQRAARTCAIAFRCLCVCSRGGIAVPWWCDLHIQLSAAHDWVLFGGRSMLSLRSFTFSPLGDGSGVRWVLVKMLREWAKSGTRGGQEWANTGRVGLCVQPVVGQGQVKSWPRAGQ